MPPKLDRKREEEIKDEPHTPKSYFHYDEPISIHSRYTLLVLVLLEVKNVKSVSPSIRAECVIVPHNGGWMDRALLPPSFVLPARNSGRRHPACACAARRAKIRVLRARSRSTHLLCSAHRIVGWSVGWSASVTWATRRSPLPPSP